MALDLTPLQQPRRIVLSVLLFALLAGGTGGIVGLAVASDAEMPMAGPVTIPTPRVGEGGTYTLRAVSLPEPGAPTEQLGIVDHDASGTLRFQFREPASILNSDGDPRRVAVVWYDDQTPATENNMAWDAVENYGVWVNVESWATEAYFDQWYDIDEEETEQGTEKSYSDSFSANYHDEVIRSGVRPVCGMVGIIQGSTVLGGETGAGISACRNAHDRNAAQGTWAVLGTVEEDERRYAVVQVTARNFHGLLWYQDGLAVPTRVEITGDRWFRDDHTLVAELVAHEPGQGGDALDAPPLKQPVRLEFAETDGPVLLDDSGLDHPFTATAAHEQALKMQESGLADFMDQYPDAYIVDAHYLQFHRIENDREWFEYEWRFDYRFEDEMHEVNIGRSTWTPQSAVNDQGVLDDLLGNNETTPEEATPEYYLYGSWDPQASDYGPWWPRPNNLPTVASMLEHYAGMAHGEAAGLEPNAWKWTVREAHDEARIILNAGRTQDTPYPENGEYTYHREWAYLAWEIQDGDQPYRYAQRFHVTSLPDQEPPGVTPQGGAHAVATGRWDLPAGAAAAIGAGAGLIAFAYYFWPVLKSGLFGGLFSRVQPAAALENPVRARVHQLVQQNPGIHFQQVVRTVGIAEGNTSYHLRKLEELGLVTSKKAGGYTCYFEKGAVDRRVMAALTQVRSPSTQAILQSVVARPGVTNAQLEVEHGLAKGTVSYHLAKLRKAGLIESKGGHRPTDLARSVAAA